MLFLINFSKKSATFLKGKRSIFHESFNTSKALLEITFDFKPVLNKGLYSTFCYTG
jgi:hypothetical protein